MDRIISHLFLAFLLSGCVVFGQVAYPRPDVYTLEYMERGLAHQQIDGAGNYENNIVFGGIGTDGTGSITLSTNYPHSGQYSMLFSVQSGGYRYLQTFAHTNVGGGGDTYYRMYIRPENDNLSSTQGFVMMCPTRDNIGNIVEINLMRGASGLYLNASVLGNGTTIIPTNAWTCIETRFKPSSGAADGIFTIWINDVEEMTTTTHTRTNAPNGLRFGIYRNNFSKGIDLYVDDIQVGPTKCGLFGPAVDLIHPRFNSRIGAPVKMMYAEANDGDTISLVLTNSDGFSNTVYSAEVLSQPIHMHRLVLTNLGISTYTLTATLADSNAVAISSDSFTWEKPYAGDPVWSIDEYNRFTSNGIPFFPITPFIAYLRGYGGGTNALDKFDDGYINVFNGMEEFVTYTNSSQWVAWQNTVTARGLPIIGPLQGPTWNATNAYDILYSYMTNTAIIDDPMFVGWNWYDEGIDLQNIPPSFMYDIWSMIETNCPSRWLMQNLMSSSFYEVTVTEIREGFWPWMIQDVYGIDLYPNGHACKWSFWHYFDSIHRLRYWNYDMVPTGGFVETAALEGSTDHPCYPVDTLRPPTANQVKLMSWMIPIAGGNFLSWYHYQGVTSNEIFAVMKTFVDDTIALNSGLCGIPGDTITSSDTNLLCLSKTDGTTNYLFAANWSSNTLSGVTFTGSTSFESGKAVANYFGGTAPTMSDGQLSADFGSQEVRIFFWRRDTQERRKATIGRATLGRGTY